MTKIASFALIGMILSACGVQSQEQQARAGGSKFKSVTINQPKFRDSMDKNLSVDLAKQADELIKNLLVKISAEPQNCNSGVTAEKKDFGEKKLEDSIIDSSYKFKKGCDYVVKLTYLDATTKAVILGSDGKTVNLTKAELEQPKPVAKIKLLVSEAGRKFWSTVPLLETPAESDVVITPEIESSSAQSLSAPACAEPSALTMASAVSCLNQYRMFYRSAADDHKLASWHSKYQQALATMSELTAPSAEESSKTQFCLNLTLNRNAVSTAQIAIASGSPSDAEEIFLDRLVEVTSKKFNPILDATTKLAGCSLNP